MSICSTKRIDLGETTIVQMIFRDLTEQRKLERKIRESKRSLQTIFDGIRDQLSLQRPDYEIMRVNRAVVEHYQITFQELIGRKCFETYYGRTTPCEECPVSETLETKQPASSIRKFPEEERTLQIFSYPILDEQRNLISVLEYTQDITEQQHLQDQLIRSEKLAGLGTLTSGFAHEINNPLSGVLGMAEIAMEEESSLKIRDYLKDILDLRPKDRGNCQGVFFVLADGEERSSNPGRCDRASRKFVEDGPEDDQNTRGGHPRLSTRRKSGGQFRRVPVGFSPLNYQRLPGDEQKGRETDAHDPAAEGQDRN